MKITKQFPILILFLTATLFSYSQRILSEDINYYNVRTPNNPLDESIKTYKVIVETPYTLTAEQVRAQSLSDFEKEKANYANVVAESKIEFQKQLDNYDEDVARAKDIYETEMADFKELSMLERLALTEQGKKPTLKVPARPQYVEPREPVYREPNLDDYLIFDNDVLADGIKLSGYEKGSDVLFVINISKMQFQDNGGQTFYSQPTTLKVLKGAEQLDEKVFDEEFKFLTSSNSNSINLGRYEKDNVIKIIGEISTYINEEFGYIPVASKIEIEYPKNKDREYDALENAKNKAISAYRKLKEDISNSTRERALSELAEVRKVWQDQLKMVDYNDKKAVMNAKVGKMIMFNLLRVDVTLKDKIQAEETLALMQEKRIDLDFNYYEEEEFTALEEQVYNLQ
jgi:hypothetical protein